MDVQDVKEIVLETNQFDVKLIKKFYMTEKKIGKPFYINFVLTSQFEDLVC